MDLTTNETRCFREYEDRREADEIGEQPGDVECSECSGDFNADDGVILLGLTVCTGCALPAACRERLAEGWSERPMRDRLDILDVIVSAAQAEESALRRSMRRGS